MSDDSTLGRVLADRYRVEELVARGGMARVYRAHDVRLARDVAVKVLSSPYADDPAFTARFLAEARAAASLSHPSLVHVYDSGSDGDANFIVMELLDRHRSLRQAIDADGPLPRDEVLRIGVELLAGLRVVHDRGLVHCDVKSGNVMLGPGPAKLIDFGIARSPNEAIEGDTSIGSLQFMSPEQLHGEPLTAASDLFSLGVVLYEALTGRVPYPGRTPDEMDAAHRAGRVRPPSEMVRGVPGRVDDAILQALRPVPASRFLTATAMSTALASAEAAAAHDTDNDETRVIEVGEPRGAAPAPARGYVPPAASPPAPRRKPRGRPAAPRRRGSGVRALGTVAVLGVAAAVVFFVVVPLLGPGLGNGPGPSASASDAPVATPGVVTIPDTVGRSTADAIAAAQEAGLDWTVRCAQDPKQPEGIIGQEPPAGTSVAPGSLFTMFSARISDCR